MGVSAEGRLHVVVPRYQEEPNLPRLFESLAGLAAAGLAQGAPAFVVVEVPRVRALRAGSTPWTVLRAPRR